MATTTLDGTAPPRTPAKVFQVKPSNKGASTTATLIRLMSRKGRRSSQALASAVLLATSATVLHGHHLALIVGATLIPELLEVAFVLAYILASMLAVVTIPVCALLRRPAPAARFEWLFMVITNSPIAFLTLTPLQLPHRAEPPSVTATAPAPSQSETSPADAVTHASEPVPPGPPGSAELQAIPDYFRTIVNNALPSDRVGQATIPDPADRAQEGPGKDPGRHRRGEPNETLIPEMSR